MRREAAGMIVSTLKSLRLGGYAPRTLLDVGANLGSFTRVFLGEFPDCTPTLIEPNRHCLSRLKSLPYEIIGAAASCRDGTAEIHLTKDWLESTGASLYRENTAHFRDEVVFTETVDTVRIDSVFEGRKFDFVKIDVQGAELDVLNGGADVIRQADYVLIEIPIVEYNAGAPPPEMLFKKLHDMGFKCTDLTEFHRLSGVMNGALLQIDVLFERSVRRATQNHRYGKFHDHAQVLAFMKSQKAACPDFSVLDVGASALPWTAEVVDATFDMNQCPAAAMHFRGNINSVDDWAPILKHVARNGKFSYSVCSHTLEDVAYPALALDMLPCVSEAGYISVPSKYLELLRIEGPYRGFIHHRWIFCIRNDIIILVPKVSLVDYLPIANEEAWRQDPDRWEVQIHWRKGLRYAILNNDYLGPTAAAVVEMYQDILTKETTQGE